MAAVQSTSGGPSKAGGGPSFAGSIVDGTQELRSWTGGNQPDSRKETAPMHVFGSEARCGSAAGASRSVGLSPGPIYLPSPRGRMGDGPKFTFGGVGATESASRRAGAAPGPGEYEAPGALGAPQAFSTSASAPRYGWGTGGRHKPAIGSVGPATACGEFYELDESMGPQALSARKCASNYSFSHDARFDTSNRTTNPSARNPGPGSYKVVDATGTQVSSVLKSQPQYGFSRAQRFRPRTSSAGPDALQGQMRGAVGTQVSDRGREGGAALPPHPLRSRPDAVLRSGGLGCTGCVAVERLLCAGSRREAHAPLSAPHPEAQVLIDALSLASAGLLRAPQQAAVRIRLGAALP